MSERAEVLAKVLADAMHNLSEALYWGDDGEGGEHFIEWPVLALSEHLAHALATREGDLGGAELRNWRRACDEVGVPHNPAALIRHHRNNVDRVNGDQP